MQRKKQNQVTAIKGINNILVICPMPSTVIRSIVYDTKTNELTIAFVSGLVYVYNEVPESVYDNFKTFREKGIYFNQQIKGKYSYKKITERV